MPLFAHLFLLGGGGYIVLTLFKEETRIYALGKTNRYLGVSFRNCSASGYQSKLRISVLKSMLIRLAITAGMAATFYVYCRSFLPDGLDAMGDLGRLSRVEYGSLWLSSSMIAMGDRFVTAYHAALGKRSV